MFALDRAITPRPWQVDATRSWARELRGIAQVVTGAGKTVFSYLCLREFFGEYPDGRAIIVVPTLALLDQWFVDICDATDVDEREVACYSGVSSPERPARVNVVVLNTARRIAEDLSRGTATMLVVDECHRAGSLMNSNSLRGFHEATLGLSATPERENDDGFRSRLIPALGPVIYRYDYRRASRDGVIVDFDLVNVEIVLEQGEISRLPRGVRKGELSVIQRALRVPWASKLALQHKNERVLVFHERVESLARIEKLLASQGQNSVQYHSNLSEAHRRDNLRLFRRGAVNVLVSCRALDEGANVPEANLAVIAQSTSSTRQRIQRLGRVLRPADGKTSATVYTLYAGKEEEERLKSEEASLEGLSNVTWRRGQVF